MPHESSSPVAHTLDCVSTVTNNHDLETSHRNVGAMVLDIFSAYRSNTERNHCNTTTTAEGFTTMLSDLCGLLKPCRKEWCHGLVRQPNATAWLDDVPLETLHTILLFAAVGREGGKGHESECDFISLNFFTLHRVHLQQKVQAQTFGYLEKKKGLHH